MEKVRVHQVLHGYSDGHRQLAASIDLAPRDAKTMLVFSDMSSSGVRLDDGGYLTGYPLAESGLYAFARTWPAPEMPRPGCVWTHTLLIEFSDLAAIHSLSRLLDMFSRPEQGDYSSFKKTLPLTDGPSQMLAGRHLPLAISLLEGLYGQPRKKIVLAQSDSLNVERLVVEVWAQQWPRLRRNFRFCTFSTSDRSIDSHKFDVQVIPSQLRSARSLFHDSIDIDQLRAPHKQWMDIAIQDLYSPDATGLRGFLRFAGADVAGGRDAFAALCQLYILTTQFARSPGAIREAIDVVESGLARESVRAIRRSILTAIVTVPMKYDDATLHFVRDNWDGIGASLWEQHGVELFTALWRENPVEVMALMQKFESPSPEVFGQHLFPALSMEDVISGVETGAIEIADVIKYLPDLLTSPKYWERSIASYDIVRTCESENRANKIAILVAMISAGRAEFASFALRDFGFELVMAAISNVSELMDRGHLASKWIVEAVRDPNQIAHYLASEGSKAASTLEQIARAVSPDTVPNDYGTDPWILACKNAQVDFDDTNRYLAPFMLSRALGPRSRNVAELVILGFDSTLHQVNTKSIDRDTWEAMLGRLPITFFSLDAEQLVIRAVANLFVDKDLWPPFFVEVTSKKDTFEELVHCCLKRWYGYRYLKKVYWHMESESKPSAAKLKILKKILDIDEDNQSMQ